LLGGQVDRIPSYTAKPYDIITPASARYTFAADMVRALTAKAEKDKEDKIRSGMLAAIIGDEHQYDPSKASESFTPSPLMESHRVALANAQAQAQPEGVSALGLGSDSTALAPDSLQSMPLTDFEPEDIETLIAQAPSSGIGSEALVPPQFESTDFTPQPNLGDDAAMRAALIGDIKTPLGYAGDRGGLPASTEAEELAAYTGSAEDRAAQERAHRATVNTIAEEKRRMAQLVASNPNIVNSDEYAQWVQSIVTRQQALVDEQRKHGRALEVAEAGRAPAGLTVKTVPNPNYPSGYGYVDLRTMRDLGEAVKPGAATEITNVIGSGELHKGYRTTPEGAEAIPGGSEDPEVIAEKEKVTKKAALQVKNLEKLPGKRGAIYADHIKTPTLRTSINQAIELAKSPFSSGMAQWMLDKVPLPEVAGYNLGAAHDLQVALDSVKANVGFNELLRIKEAGGTLGALSEMENRLLQAMQGALVAVQDKEALIPALKQVMEIWELNLQQKKNEFKSLYSKAGGWETDERRPWEPPPDSGISQQEWDEMNAEEKASMEAGA